MNRILAITTLLFNIALPSTLLANGPGTYYPLLPYHGYLESDGLAAIGIYDFRVGFYSASNADASSLATTPSDNIWWDEFSDINVVAGEFSIILGSSATFNDETFVNNPDIYIAIAVRPASSGDFVLLNGKQRMLQVPFAVRPENHVEGTFYVHKDGHIISLDDANLVLNHADKGDGGRAIAHGSNNTLVVNYNNDFDGGTIIFSNTSIENNLEVKQDINAKANLNVDGEVRVQGTVRWKCPSDMERIGTWCIDKVGHAATDWESAFDVCHGSQKTLCPMSVYMQCDALHGSYSPSDNSCADWTDEGTTAAEDDLWSQDIGASIYYQSTVVLVTEGVVFENIVTYDGEGNHFNIENSTNSNRYFCCIPGSLF